MKVGDLVDAGHAEIKTGPFGTQLRASDYVEHGRPVLNVRNVGFGDVRPKDLEHVDEGTAERLSTHLLKVNDIVFGRKGAVERHALISEKYDGAMQGSDCIRLRVSEDSPMQARFITFALRTQQHQKWMQAFCSHGATMASLNQDIVRQIPLPDIDSAHQELAVAVLQNIDDLIDNNQRRVQILEEMARATYREWFVKFRYAGHEDVALVDSAHGPIPEGWRCEQVDSLVFLQRGFDLPQRDREAGPIPIIGASGVQGSHSASKAQGPGVATGRSGTVGVVTYVPGEYWPLNTALWVKEFRLATPRYAFFLLEELDLKRAASGAAVPTLDRKVVHALPAVCPPKDLIERWDAAMVPTFETVEALRAQSDRVAALRDLLLPKLVTGQIDVSMLDLDALVEGRAA